MREAEAKCRGCFARSNMTTRFMARAAGRNIATACLVAGLRLRAMALITRDMRVESRGNRHGHTGARGSMTSNATDAAHSHVACMIEFHVEAAQAREWFQLARLRIGMTDRAHRA
jgi:hypothetical protein